VKGKAKNWKEILKKVKRKYPEDVVEALKLIGTTEEDSDEYEAAEKLIQAKIKNLESNSFIEIDIERIEDRSKALSYIGIEVAEALKYIPAPTKVIETNADIIQTGMPEEIENPVSKPTSELLQDIITETGSQEANLGNDNFDNFVNETRFETKPSLWERIKNSKFVRTVRFILKIRVVLEYPALPEGRGE